MRYGLGGINPDIHNLYRRRMRVASFTAQRLYSREKIPTHTHSTGKWEIAAHQDGGRKVVVSACNRILILVLTLP
jgi:hypothetical protein